MLIFNFKLIIGQRRVFEPHLKIGGSYGLTFSRVDFQPYKKQKFVYGNNPNLELFYSSQPNVGVKLVFGILKKGWKVENDTTGLYTKEMDYSNISFTTHIEIWQKRKFNLLIDVGPYIGFLKQEKEIVKSNNYIEIFTGKKIDNKFEFGFIGGTGVQYNLKNHSFFVAINYYNSLTNIFNPSEDFQYFASRNQTLGINFGYLIKLF